MKVYFYNNGLTIAGKAWQIRAKLKELQKQADTVEALVNKRRLAKNRSDTHSVEPFGKIIHFHR